MNNSSNPFDAQFFRRLQLLKIHTRRSFLGSRQGTHVSLRRGHGLEFSDYRPYTYGDDFRYIDWGAFARTDRLYVRQFREEQDLNVICMLDTSGSMGQANAPGKFSMAKNIALGLGYIALTDGDAVRFSFLGQKLSPAYRGARQFAKLVKECDSTVPQGVIDLGREIMATVSGVRLPGKCFLVSDLMMPLGEIAKALGLLVGRNFEVTVIQVLSPQELRFSFPPGAYQLRDVETDEIVDVTFNTSSGREYAEALSNHVATIERICHQAEVRHVLVSSGDDFANLMFKRFPEVGLLR